MKKGLKSRGDVCVRQCNQAKSTNWTRNRKQSNRLAVSLWQDNRAVVVASTNCNPTETMHVQRRQKDGSRLSIQCPSSISLYNTYMGGVDHNDQLHGYYSVRTKGKKCYRYIWWFLFDVAVTNMYITHLWLSSRSSSFVLPSHETLLVNFKVVLDVPVSSAIPSHRFCLDHFPMKSPKRGRCYYCYHMKKRRHDTSWWCTTCKKYLCHEGNNND